MMPTASAAPGGEKPPLGVYIHFPFCRSKCAYCDFVSYPGREELIPAYVDALTGEIRDWREEISRRRIVSVFFGGGTPSLMDPEQMRVLLTCLADTGCVSPDAEITVEANPGTVTPGALSAFRAMGVDRLSLGVQAAQDPLLRSIGRIHTLKEAAAAVDMAREAGFGNLNLDLMYGLPGQTEADWRETLEWAVSRDPEHISAYSLIIEEGTPFYERFGDIAGEERVGTVGAEYDRVTGGASGPDAPNGEEPLRLPDEEEDRVMEHMTGEILAEYGYEQYEISNYAKPGFACRHNLGYWSDVPYIGFGLGASSYLGGVRWANPRDLNAYLEAASAGAGAFIPEKTDVQVLTEAEREEEFFFLGLRRTDGVEAADFAERFGRGWDRYLPAMERLERDGFLERTAGGFRLTRAGQDVSNTVFAEILF